MTSLEVLRKALDKFPNTTKVCSSVQIQKHPTIPGFKVAVVECAFCGKKEKHDIFDERVEEWKQLGEKKALCKTCALKLGKIFVWYNDFKDLFSVFQADYDKQVHVSRKQLSELFQDFPMPSRIKYYESSYTGTPVFMTERWDKDFFKWEKKVFGEAFSKKGSLLEASETKDPCECPGCHQDFSSCICNEETRK